MNKVVTLTAIERSVIEFDYGAHAPFHLDAGEKLTIETSVLTAQGMRKIIDQALKDSVLAAAMNDEMRAATVAKIVSYLAEEMLKIEPRHADD